MLVSALVLSASNLVGALLIAWAIKGSKKAPGGPEAKYVDLDAMYAEKMLQEEYSPEELVFEDQFPQEHRPKHEDLSY